MTAWCIINSEALFCFPTLSIKLLVKNGKRHNDYKRFTVKLYKIKTWIDHKTITKKTLNIFQQWEFYLAMLKLSVFNVR